MVLVWIVLGGLLAAGLGWLALWLVPRRPVSKTVWGLTYSAPYAEELGLDARTAYLEILDQLKPKRLRLVSYWDQNNPAPDSWNFDELDFQAAEAEKRRIPYVIAVGRRVPRWPECYSPEWTTQLPEAEQQQALYAYLTKVVQRYDSNSNLTAWQVENEPDLPNFGQCPEFGLKYLPDEVALVRSLSAKGIMVTAGGESFTRGWGTSRHADLFATSLYRAVRNPEGAPRFLKLPPGLYLLRALVIRLVSRRVKRVFISELQAEPWVERGMADHDQAYYDETMSLTRLKAMVDFAQRTRLPEVWFWGAEWWCYQKLRGEPAFWDYVESIFRQSRD